MKYKLLLALMFCGILSSFSFPVTFSWNLPGAVEIKRDSYQSEEIIGPADSSDTYFEYECDESCWLYLIAAEGYKIESCEINGGSASAGFYAGRMYAGKFMYSAGSFKVTLVPTDRCANFDIMVENGADYISAVFNDGYPINLKNGANKIAYDPEIEKSLTLKPYGGPSDFYSISLNGEPLKNQNEWASWYSIPDLSPDDKLNIRVFEGEEPPVKDCLIKVSFSEGIKDCLVSILNRSTSEWLTLESDQLTVRSGMTIQFNFNTDDYVIERIMLNDSDKTSELINSSSFRMTVEDDALLTIEGREREYPEVDYTLYIMNPEGVRLYRGGYHQNPLDPEAGDPISAPITLPPVGSTDEIFMTPDNTQAFNYSLRSKRTEIYIAPREGWYIYTVQGLSDNKMTELPYVTSETSVAYIVAQPFDKFSKATFNVVGDAHLLLTGSSLKTMQWDNPDLKYELNEGLNEIEFMPGYNLPLSLRTVSQVPNMGVFLDGAPVLPDENNVYSITPYSTSSIADNQPESEVTVVCSGKLAETGRVNIKIEGNLDVKAYYGKTERLFDKESMTLLEGTVVSIVPSVDKCTISINGKVVNGYNEEGELIEGLDASGAYVFDVIPGKIDINIMEGQYNNTLSVSEVSEGEQSLWTIDGKRMNSDDQLSPGIYIKGKHKIMITPK